MSTAGSISDDDDLLRRVHPEQVVDDQNSGVQRPSSAAFKDPELSVDSSQMLGADGLDWTFSLREHPSHSLVRFQAKAAREKQLLVEHKPISDNPYHCEVIGKKTQGISNHLRDASTWVHIAPKK